MFCPVSRVERTNLQIRCSDFHGFSTKRRDEIEILYFFALLSVALSWYNLRQFRIRSKEGHPAVVRLSVCVCVCLSIYLSIRQSPQSRMCQAV